jgi:cytochrome c5
MKRTIAATLLSALAITGMIRAVAAQQKDEPLDPRIAAYDKGPAKIDVSKYPAEMKTKYKVFAEKCAKCHSIARPINCEFALEDEWERYIKRMMNKAGPSVISAADGKTIYEFLVYDSKTRKKDLYDKKTKEGVK